MDPIELLEVQLCNVTAPFILVSRLRAAMAASAARRKYVVNVSAMEGQFSRGYKGPGHPHTNMAKAALNMLTRTSAREMLDQDGILMTAVDTGWITDERPHPDKARLAARGLPRTPRPRRRRRPRLRPDHRAASPARICTAVSQGLPAASLVSWPFGAQDTDDMSSRLLTKAPHTGMPGTSTSAIRTASSGQRPSPIPARPLTPADRRLRASPSSIEGLLRWLPAGYGPVAGAGPIPADIVSGLYQSQ